MKQPYEPPLVCTVFINMNKEEYMKLAMSEAKKAYKENEVPIGCVIVKEDKVIAKAHNKKEKKNCSVHHAEIEAIKKACKVLNTWHLDGCEMYVTLEPCMMCTGAIVNSRIKKVYYSTADPKGGCIKTCFDITKIKSINHHPEYKEGLLEEESIKLLKSFFKDKR